MKFLDKVNVAFKDLTNRKFRSILTIIAISIGTLLIVGLTGVGDAIINENKKLLESFGDMSEIYIYPEKAQYNTTSGITVSVNNNSVVDLKKEGEEVEKEDNFKKITDKELEEISKIKGIDNVMATLTGNISGIKLENEDYIDKSYTAIGIDFKYKHDFSDDIEVGSSLINEDEDIIIGESILKKLGFDNANEAINKEIILKVEYPAIDGFVVKEPLEVKGKIKGILKKDMSYNQLIMMSSKKLEPLVAYYSDSENYIEEYGYSMAYAYAKDGQDVELLSNEITSKFEYITESLSAVSSMLDIIGGVLKGILSIAGIIVLIVSALGLINTMTMILQEKKKMIGVMRSVGGSKNNIRWIFILQSIFLGIAGGILGSGMGALGIYIVNETITKLKGLIIPITANNILIAIGITVIISIIAGLIPSSRAAKLNVVEAVAEE